jgi:hypothetical protein
MPYSLRPPAFSAGVVDDDVMALDRKAVGAGKTGWTGADHGDLLPSNGSRAA